MKQYEAVILTLEKLGGVATLGELNHEVFKIEECEWKTKTPFASIRRIVQQRKEIYKIKPGLYGLEQIRKENESRGIIQEDEKNKNSTIDVIWFNNRFSDDKEVKLPHSFFEVEHSTDIQNSLLKYNDLQDFYTEMFIVADEIRKKEFEKKIRYSAFKDLKVNNRVKFLSYNRLVELYEITKKNLQGINF